MSEKLITNLTYYGISPWEMEIVYTNLNERFEVKQKEIDSDDPDFVSYLRILFPLSFNDAFFKWFEFRRWDKIKFLFKEMKRRRRNTKGIKIEIIFTGKPTIIFVIDTEDRQWFNTAVEKTDFVLELLPYHLDPKKLPENVTDVIYSFDTETVRWKINTAMVDGKKFVFENNVWN